MSGGVVDGQESAARNRRSNWKRGPGPSCSEYFMQVNNALIGSLNATTFLGGEQMQ